MIFPCLAKGGYTVTHEDSTPGSEIPEKSEEYQRFEDLARKMFATPKMETKKQADERKKTEEKLGTE